MITDIEQETNDFDWFFTDGNAVGHVASGGGKLPPSVARSVNGLNILQNYFNGLPTNSDVIVNIQSRTTNDDHLMSFADMAKKGLYSFDKTHLGKPYDTAYHLIAKPGQAIQFKTLPEEIKEILINSRYIDSFGSIIDVKDVT